MNWLEAHGAEHGVGCERVVLSGHSAGGHLTAALLAESDARLALGSAIIGGIAISPIVDFAPLLQTSYNFDLQLTAESAARLSLASRKPKREVPLLVAAGGDESSEFQRQARLLAESWAGMPATLEILPGYNHFSIVDAFAERGQPLHEKAKALFA
jgi:arylformamidase